MPGDLLVLSTRWGAMDPIPVTSAISGFGGAYSDFTSENSA